MDTRYTLRLLNEKRLSLMVCEDRKQKRLEETFYDFRDDDRETKQYKSNEDDKL